MIFFEFLSSSISSNHAMEKLTMMMTMMELEFCRICFGCESLFFIWFKVIKK
ncbi:hypothetical protein HanIR_Chr17g0867591 [Helianthus annuus]|nr:hypothetical protein HanIR_Chr17g0867591 [Helianthus annuus]